MDSLTANRIAHKISILDDNVIIVCDYDIPELKSNLDSLNIRYLITDDPEAYMTLVKDFTTVLWLLPVMVRTPGRWHEVNILDVNLTTRVSFPKELYHKGQWTSINLDNITDSKLSEMTEAEFKTYWPDLHEKYNHEIGYVFGGAYADFNFTNTSTITQMKYIGNLVANGAKKIVISQAQEGAMIRFLVKAQLIANACKKFISPENFYIMTSAMGTSQAWKNFCKEHQIQNPVNVMEFNFFAIQKYAPIKITYEPDKTHNNVYTSLNAGIQRIHRYMLAMELMDNELLDKGLVSFGEYTDWDKMVDYGSEESKQRLQDTLPIWLDIENNGGAGINQLPESDQSFLYDSYVNIVTETQFFSQELEWSNEDGFLLGSYFFTEKIFKPMYFKQPFLVVGPPGYLEHLRKNGFQTFDGIVDESYDKEPDDYKRLQMVVKELKRLSEFTDQEWIDWKTQAWLAVEHNHEWLIKNDLKVSEQEFTDMFND